MMLIFDDSSNVSFLKAVNFLSSNCLIMFESFCCCGFRSARFRTDVSERLPHLLRQPTRLYQEQDLTSLNWMEYIQYFWWHFLLHELHHNLQLLNFCDLVRLQVKVSLDRLISRTFATCQRIHSDQFLVFNLRNSLAKIHPGFILLIIAQSVELG